MILEVKIWYVWYVLEIFLCFVSTAVIFNYLYLTSRICSKITRKQSGHLKIKVMNLNFERNRKFKKYILKTAGEVTTVRVNMLIRSMGPISETDMVGMIIFMFIYLYHHYYPVRDFMNICYFSFIRWTATSASTGETIASASRVSNKRQTMWSSIRW